MTIKRNTLFGWIIPGAGAVAVAAALLVWQWPGISAGFGTGDPSALPAAVPAQALVLGGNRSGGPVESADHVRVTALRSGATVTAHLFIDKGWHLNANPASLRFLIATALSLHSRGKALASTVDYPRGHTIDVGLKRPIRVYSGEVSITATLSDAAATPVKAVLRLQACSNRGRCLVPSIVKTRALPSKR